MSMSCPHRDSGTRMCVRLCIFFCLSQWLTSSPITPFTMALSLLLNRGSLSRVDSHTHTDTDTGTHTHSHTQSHRDTHTHTRVLHNWMWILFFQSTVECWTLLLLLLLLAYYCEIPNFTAKACSKNVNHSNHWTQSTASTDCFLVTFVQRSPTTTFTLNLTMPTMTHSG